MTDERTPPDPELEAALAGLRREADPPPALEERVVSALRSRGHLRPVRRTVRWVLAAGLAAAAIALVLLTRRGPGGGEYLLLIAEDARYRGPADSAEAQARVQEYGAWAGRLAGAGRLVSAGELAPTGTAVHADGRTPAGADGVSGYFLVRAGSLAEAEQLASESPHLRYGGVVVVRPVVP